MYFRIYGPQKTWLDKCLKSVLSKNLNENNLTIFIDHCEGNRVGKTHS